VGSGPDRQSFVDYLRDCCLPDGLREHSQLEVFHWMIEWVTRPYYDLRGGIYEGRLLEAAMINILHKIGADFGERLYHWHGNLLYLTDVNHDSIPYSWNLAKRRYLKRCVDLYGGTIATAGTHTNLSIPEPLLAWDFMHLHQGERRNGHLDDYKNRVYITATRLMRAFAALFVATSAATPFKAEFSEGKPVVKLTPYDSIRNLTFPNPYEIDPHDLYRSHPDYLQISYDLVHSGVRFGNNNWTPVRARSFAEPVERLIAVTSEQLHAIYTRGLYAIGEDQPADEMARRIEQENLLARINIPMARVEIRTDDGGNPLDVDLANLTFKHLLLLLIYADQSFARGFRYDQEDIDRARRNELLAAKDGLRAEIENPLTGKPIPIREFLAWTLKAVHPLADILGLWDDLTPLVEMSEGGPNTAERLRQRFCNELGHCQEVPPEVLQELAAEREAEVDRDVELIAGTLPSLGTEARKLREVLQHARHFARNEPDVPIRIRPAQEKIMEETYPDKTSEIVSLARQLIRIPSVTVGAEERLDEIHQTSMVIFDYLRDRGLDVRFFDGKFPAILVNFPDVQGDVLLSGHFDVVAPEPDDTQFDPHIEGDYLWGRGAADMKTVVATYMVWMKDTLKVGPPYPQVGLLLVSNEENGEAEPMGTPHVLRILDEESGYHPKLLIAGERTEERGTGLWGEICTQNRGIIRFDLVGHGQRGHSGVSGAEADLSTRMVEARIAILKMFERHLTLTSEDGWQSTVRFPFMQVGTPGIYNITADYGVLGVESRPIPQDDIETLFVEIEAYCIENNFDLENVVCEAGIACDEQNIYLKALVGAVEKASGQPAPMGRKLPGTSARFAPHGQGIVWGQSGIGPHAVDERHYIPSIVPYYRALQAFGEILVQER